MRVFWSGFPGDSGGANTECWHTARLLRDNGVDVTFMPTKGADLKWQGRLEGIGCKVQMVEWDKLEAVDGLPGSIVISMCNSNFIGQAHRFRDLGCKTCWANCMTFVEHGEQRHYTNYGEAFDAYVFQSEWQRAKLEPILAGWKYTPDRGHLIRGAFYPDEFPLNPKPHASGEPFVVGRLSRAAGDKYSSNLWPICKQISDPKHLRCMAWAPEVERKCGKPERHGLKADLLPSCAETPQAFLGSLHCLLQVNGGAGENWPRTGLEAMAAGVPIVAQDQWGWKEMIQHGETGFLCGDEPAALAAWPNVLAADETYRQRIIKQAREHMLEITNPERIWPSWETMLNKLAG